MKKIKKIIAAATLCVMSISFMGCKMIQKTPEAIAKTTVAKVGDEKITKGDFEQAFKQYDMMFKQQYGEDYADNAQLTDQIKQYKQQCLTQLIDQSVLLQKASEAKLMSTDKEINAKYEENMKQVNENKEQLQAFLKAYGFTEDSFKEYVKKQATVELIYNKIVEKVNVTDKDVETYYNENKATKYTQEGAIDYDKSLQEANAVEQQLKSGEDFAKVAKEKSQDPSVAQNNGDLGFIEYNSTKYDPDFMAGFKDLKEGEVSEPVKSQFGYHIIKVTKVTKDGANVSHILLASKGKGTVTPLDSVKDEIKSELEGQKKNTLYQEKVEELKKGVTIKTYEDRL